MTTQERTALTKQDIFRLLRENRVLLDCYAVRRIALFGSHAKGSQGPRSDVDLLVEFENPIYDNFVGLSRALEGLFGRKVEILTPEGLESIRVPSIAESIREALTYGS